MDPFNFADASIGVLAQRLVRTHCPECKKSRDIERSEFDEMVNAYGEKALKNLGITFSKDLQISEPVGCDHCNGTGFRGRMAIHELLVATDRIKEAIQSRARVDEIRKIAIDEGMTTLLQDGIDKVFQGHTDFKEVRRVCVR